MFLLMYNLFLSEWEQIQVAFLVKSGKAKGAVSHCTLSSVYFYLALSMVHPQVEAKHKDIRILIGSWK